MDPVFAFANRLIGVPFRWGESDCVMVVADYVRAVTGRDPAADLRLTYSSAGECQRVTGFFTNPLGCIAPRLEACGLRRVSEAQKGDVGIVLQMVAGRAPQPHGAICLGQGNWLVKSQEAVAALVPLKVVAAWRF